MASILAGLPAARQPRLAAESALRSLPPSPASCSYQLRSTGRFARGGAAQADSFNLGWPVRSTLSYGKPYNKIFNGCEW